MEYHVNLDGSEGSWWEAYVIELPGCIATGSDKDHTLAALPEVITRHLDWLAAHDQVNRRVPIEVELVESHRAWRSSPDYEVGAFFVVDRPPLGAEELEEMRMLLEWSRQDLIDELSGITDKLEVPVEDDWSVSRILRHLAQAESFYMRRLGVDFPSVDDSQSVLERLEDVRHSLVSILPVLAGDARLTVVEYETWSARKVLRRALCHERDHYYHLKRFKENLLSPD